MALAVIAHAQPSANADALAAAFPSPRVQPVTGEAPALSDLIARMEQAEAANPSRSRAYVLTREYKFYQGCAAAPQGNQSPGEKAGQKGDEKEGAAEPKSDVVARVNFLPPNTKTYDIVVSRGNGRGESAVKHMLENESELARDVTKSEISRRNYEFALLGQSTVDGRRAFVLALTPRREDHALFSGRVFLDAETFRILRLDGRPARSPSWWLKSSYVVMHFGDVEGMWLPVATEGSAEVRIFGHFELASRKISDREAQQVAALGTARERASGADPAQGSSLSAANTASGAASNNFSASHGAAQQQKHGRARSAAAVGSAIPFQQ